MAEGRILAETPAYLVAYKNPGVHSAPLKGGEGGTLLDWCAGLFPEVRSLRGRKPGEGGLLHRLDFETSGLVLFARTQAALEKLNRDQEGGGFIKRYGALGARSSPLPGMPPAPPPPEKYPACIESAFRPWGPGRRAVRPVNVSDTKGSRLYRTVILEQESAGEYRRFRLEISRGFRHQLRCHLAWLGFPLLGDSLYGGPPRPGTPGIALLAEEITFPDPLSGEIRLYRVPPIASF